MNGSDDEQHDAHVKCYRIAVAVADGDAVEAAYDKHLAMAGSTDERNAAYRAYVLRVSSAWKDAPSTSPPELLLAPGRILARHQPDPGRVPTETPSDPPPSQRSRSPPEPRCPGWCQPAGSPRSSGIMLGYDFGLGSSGKLDFGPLLPTMRGNSSLKMAAPARDRSRQTRDRRLLARLRRPRRASYCEPAKKVVKLRTVQK